MPIGRFATAPGDLVLIQPVPVLVHRREQRLEAVLVVVRGDPHVVDAGAATRTDARSGRCARSRPRWPNISTTSWSSAICPVEREVARRRIRRSRGRELRDQRHELGLDLVEDARDLGGVPLRLEVVEQDVVGLILRARSLDVPLAQLHVALERPEEQLGVRGRPSPSSRSGSPRPTDAPIRARSSWGPARPCRGPPREPQQARVVGAPGRAPPASGADLAEQPPDLWVGEPFVGEPLEEREALRAVAHPCRRHPVALVPGEETTRRPDSRAGRRRRVFSLGEGVGHGGRRPYPQSPTDGDVPRRTSHELPGARIPRSPACSRTNPRPPGPYPRRVTHSSCVRLNRSAVHALATHRNSSPSCHAVATEGAP